MNKIKTTSEVPSAIEFNNNYYTSETVVMLRDFAKLHVKAALEAALNNVEYADGNDSAVDDIDENSILLAYPETNIK